MLKANLSEKTYGAKLVPKQTRILNSNSISIPDIIHVTYSRHYGKCMGVGGGKHLLVNLVQMLEQKKNFDKGFFFQAGQCAALSSFRVRKMAF